MKRIIPLLACTLIGVGIGWYCGYTRPSLNHQREIIRQYQFFKDKLHMTDADAAELGRKTPQYFEDVKRQDEMAAVYALPTFKFLEHGDTEHAKSILLKAIGHYYRAYRGKEDIHLIIPAIEKAAQQYPAIAANISQGTDNDAEPIATPSATPQ